MLTKDELINLFSNANRRMFLGEDIYERCKRNGNKVNKKDLENRLNFWKNDYKFTHIFKNCGVQDVAKICNFSPDAPVDDILDNKCYNDIYHNINRTELEEANSCAICLEYNKDGEFPNRISCGHYFHYSCLNDWMATNSTCPTCRKPINMLLGFPLQKNEQLFKTIQKLDKKFVSKYLNEMEMFMTKDEIAAFKQIHNIKIENSIKDRLLIFFMLVFLWNLISQGTAYITTNIDSNYVPFIERDDTVEYTGSHYLDTLENAVLFPSGLYVGFQFIILALSIFGNVLDKIRNY